MDRHICVELSLLYKNWEAEKEMLSWSGGCSDAEDRRHSPDFSFPFQLSVSSRLVSPASASTSRHHVPSLHTTFALAIVGSLLHYVFGVELADQAISSHDQSPLLASGLRTPPPLSYPLSGVVPSYSIGSALDKTNGCLSSVIALFTRIELQKPRTGAFEHFPGVPGLHT